MTPDVPRGIDLIVPEKGLIAATCLLSALVLASVCRLPPILFRLAGFAVFILAFTLFDCVGWGIAIHRLQRWHEARATVPYRIIQHFFLISLALNVWQFYGWQVVSGGLVAWWFGLCDVLFYVLLRERMPCRDESGCPVEYSWMESWSIHGLLKLLTRWHRTRSYRCRRGVFIWFGVTGCVLGLGICGFLN